MGKPLIAVIDYGMGNLRSVANALDLLGAKTIISEKPEVLENADAIVFPGVGSFGAAIDNLRKKKLFDCIKNLVREDKPFLGLCLGFQLLFERSAENPGYKGLSIIDGEVVKFKFPRSSGLKIPHMGWNQVYAEGKRSPVMFRNIPQGSYFYFVHSYYCVPKSSSVISSKTEYGKDFCSSLIFGNIWACQFHPEKSGKSGLKLISNFIDFVEQN